MGKVGPLGAFWGSFWTLLNALATLPVALRFEVFGGVGAFWGGFLEGSKPHAPKWLLTLLLEPVYTVFGFPVLFGAC